MSVGHCDLICFANLSRDRIVLGSLARLATESGPGNKEISENCIRYVDFVAKSHVPFRPPSHPLRSLNSQASLSLSLSLSLSSRSRFLSASAHVFTQWAEYVEACLVTPYLSYGDAVSASSALCGILGSSFRQA